VVSQGAHCGLSEGSVLSMLGEVLTPIILGSSTKYLIFFLSVVIVLCLN